jgi:hypothetical protein
MDDFVVNAVVYLNKKPSASGNCFVIHQRLNVIPAKAGIQGNRNVTCPGFPLSRE